MPLISIRIKDAIDENIPGVVHWCDIPTVFPRSNNRVIGNTIVFLALLPIEWVISRG